MHKKYISQIAPPPPKKNGILDNNYVFRQIFIRKYEQQPQVVQTHDLLFLKGGGGVNGTINGQSISHVYRHPLTKSMTLDL